MKILVFASCSKRKSISYPTEPICKEIIMKGMKDSFVERFPEKRTARDLYRGSLNISINSAVNQLRDFFDVSYYIVSAGFGIVEENEFVPPYNCAFSLMTKEEIIERARVLMIPDDFQEIVDKEKPDLMYLALGKTYLLALGEWDRDLPCKTIAFTESVSKEVITLPADHIAVQEAIHLGLGPIHGVVGYKGDLLLLTTRFVKNQRNPEKALLELLETPDDLVQMIDMLRKID
ncbi:MAG: hypothetical protein KGD59_13705 [Candidatus Heimdallarchaeota archaeon]|nr:hypothetical protein [Candidatus Heimdallarchaeota archaeon]MBY8995600.1 hypothetical protein [Candidatus Heimdallarchaeota archaeon]